MSIFLPAFKRVVPALLIAGHSLVSAQNAAPAVAVPYYTPSHFMQGLHRYGTAPAAAGFAEQAAALAPALDRLCSSSAATADAAAPARAPDKGRPAPVPAPSSRDAASAAAQALGDTPPAAHEGTLSPALGEARARWAAAVQAWERLAAVAVGPLIERRSLRTLDFTPPRPALIERAVKAQPVGAAAMEKIGAPAKGLPALEWLLWTQPVAPHSPDCRYAAEVAADIGREAAALAAAFEATAAREWDEAAASAAMAEAINQWLGGLERLRWQDLERPLEAAGDGGRNAPQFPRIASGLSAASWSAQWQALRALALQSQATAPHPGEGLVTIETYLRGRGLNATADALRRAVLQADPPLQGLSVEAPERLASAAQALAALGRVVQEQVAPALEVSIGFSDADGD
ncbi:MAG: imelysin family protein [Methylibium sp.]|uniref:imelysin family protein n=1 Tax=Methylibium sp. TaxID=2067992 RepID=UPI0017E9C206|nr:imelysin family protein [Methylibium sp.]MBA3598293.1 imelysin family protein [Methylibium sp.]